MLEAARLGDTTGHSHALAGMIAGTVVGGLLAAGALMGAGLGVGVLLIGASIAVGYLAGELPTASTVSCTQDGAQQMAEGSSRVFINGLAARLGDQVTCGAKVMSGSQNVHIGGDTLQTLDIASEVSEWLYKVSGLTLLFAGLAGGWGGVAKAGALAKLLAKIPGINRLASIACHAGTLLTGVAAVGIIARPVDIVSGQKFLSGEDELDFVLPSRLPLRWQRYWHSGNPGDSVLGRGWSLFWET